MSNSTTTYLTSTVIKDDPWVKGICSAGSAEEMVAFILNRICSPTVTGPQPAYLSRTGSPPELPSEIIYDLVINSYADYDLADEAMGLIMKKIVTKEIDTTPAILENVFHVIEQLVLEKGSYDLYVWIRENISYMQSQESDKKRIMLNAINALAYSQSAGANLNDFWTHLWEQSNQYWWNSAFLGIRYFDLDKAIALIPQLIDRRCSNLAFLLTSMWRIKDDTRVALALKNAVEKNETWAGIAINALALKMKYAEKTKLVERLYDSYSDISTEEENHIAAMQYFGE